MLAILGAFADLCAIAPERRDLDADPNETRASARAPQRLPPIPRPGARGPPRLVRRAAAPGPRALRRDAARREPGTRGGLAAHLRGPATPRRAARDRRDLLEGPPLVRRPARDPGSADRRDPAATPGHRQPRAWRAVQPLRSTAHRSCSSRDLGGDEGARHGGAPTVRRTVGADGPSRGVRRSRSRPILVEENLLAGTAAPGPLLAVLTRRYYKIRSLESVRVERVRGTEVCRAEYVHDGRTVHVVAVRAREEDVAEALEITAEVAALRHRARHRDRRRVPTARRRRAVDHRRAGRAVRDQLDTAVLPSSIRRVAVIPSRRRRSISSRSGGPTWTGPGPTGWRRSPTPEPSRRTSSSAGCTR